MVKRALQKDGWRITHDPLQIRYRETEMRIDLAAENVLAAERGDERIAVEIKSFLRPSTLTDFHHALGQYINYRHILRLTEQQYILYLAVPKDVYKEFFNDPFPQYVIEQDAINLLIHDPAREEIVKWIN